MTKQKAVSSDIDSNYFQAIDFYEQLLREEIATVEIFSNLAFIYWAFAGDFGFSAANNIPDEWIQMGATKYKQVIEKGLFQFPESVELHFLSKYFWHRLGVIDFSKEECLQIVKAYKEKSLVPYFYLYLFDEEKFKLEAQNLLIECEKCPTTKNKYIKSILTARKLH